MNPIVKNILAVIAGWLIGSTVNMGLINLGFMLMPIEGVNPSDMEAMAEVMPGLEPKYFLSPFLGHALGTLVGAAVAGMIAANRKMIFALVIGVLFFGGGIMVSQMLPAPTWFTAVDLIFAYIPMAFIGGKFALSRSKQGDS